MTKQESNVIEVLNSRYDELWELIEAWEDRGEPIAPGVIKKSLLAIEEKHKIS